ncbi:MAG: hypothetical protein U0V73_04805 [Acidimicrobiia bacterium]
MNGVLLVATTGAVLVGSAALAARLGLPGLLRTLLATLLFALASVMLVVLLTGWLLRDLHRPAVVLAAFLIAAAAVTVATRGAPERLPDRWHGLVRGWWRTVGGARGLVRSPWALVLGLLAAAEVAWGAVVAFVVPPYAWDGLSYHLPAVAYWLQQGHLGLTPYWIYSNVYPMNAELVFAWPTVLLGDDTLIDASQLVFALLGALAVAVLARALGARRSAAVAASSLFLLTPVVVQQLNVAYVDVALAGCFLAAFAFWFGALQAAGLVRGPDGDAGVDARLARTQFGLGGLAAGMAIGTKSVALAYVGVLGLVLLGLLAVALARRRSAFTSAAVLVACFVLPIPVLGSFWYARDWIEYGNPVHPFTLTIGGVELIHGQGTPEQTVLAGMTPRSIEREAWPRQVWASWTHVPSKYVYDQRLGGFGPWWPFVGVPAFVLAAVVMALRRRDLLVGFALPFVLVFLVQPERWWSRFTIVTVAAGAVALVWLLELLRGPRGRMVRGAVQAAVVVIVVAWPHQVTSAFRREVLGSTLGVHRVRAIADLPASRRTLGATVYPEFAWVDRIPHDARIALRLRDVSNAWVYPLLGRDLGHRLVMLPDVDDESTVARRLARSRAGYVLAVEGGTLDRILARDPRHYHLFADTGPGRVYRVVR